MLFPSNQLFKPVWIAPGSRVGCEQLPDKAAQLSRDGHDRFVALESPRQKTRVATMQPVLSSPTDGPDLMGSTFLAPTQFLAYFGRASGMLGALD